MVGAGLSSREGAGCRSVCVIPPVCLLCESSSHGDLGHLPPRSEPISTVAIRQHRESAWCCTELGITAGALALVRPSLGLLVVPLALWLRSRWQGRTAASTAVLLCCLSWAVPVVPWMVRNAQAAGQFTGLGTSAGWSFFVSTRQWSGDLPVALQNPDWQVIISDHKRRLQTAWCATGSRSGARVEVLVEGTFWTDGVANALELAVTDILGRLPVRLAYLWGTADLMPGRRVSPLRPWRCIASRKPNFFFWALSVCCGCGPDEEEPSRATCSYGSLPSTWRACTWSSTLRGGIPYRLEQPCFSTRRKASS